MINSVEGNSRRHTIDNILSTQPELGPSIPDGGYGWIILLGTLFFQLLVPSIIISYGVLLVFLRIETSASVYPEVWDNPLVYSPLFFVATWTFVDPWSKILIANSIWPRLVTTAGTSLTCCGLLFIWLAISNGTRTAGWFVVSGILSGLGASIVMTQCDVLLSQYFRMKLKHIHTCVQVTVSTGFVIVPILLGHFIIKDGLLSVILWYQIIILQGLVVCLLIRKPAYLKGTGKMYKLVQGTADEEIDIFAKNTTELQNARHSLNTEQITATIETPNDNESVTRTSTSNISNGGPHLARPYTTPVEQNGNESLIETETHVEMQNNSEWIIFEDNGTSIKNENAKVQQNLRKSFLGGTSNDLERIDTFEDDFVPIPKPLFKETYINNNNTYSYDNAESSSEEPVVFVPVNSAKHSTFNRDLSFLKQPTFYKSLFQITMLKFSIFTFYALFPSHLYTRITTIRIHHATYLVGYISISSIIFSLLLGFVKINTYRRALLLWIFSWTSSLGYIMMSDVKNEGFLIVGATLIIGSIQSLQYFGASLHQIHFPGNTNKAHIVLNGISGLMFFVFFAIDVTYVNCFRIMALLQFVMGGMWLANFLFKKIKPIVSSIVIS